MTIKVYEQDGTPVIAPQGRINHVTAEAFEEKIYELGTDSSSLTIDMADVEYVSSAALRAILKAHHLMEKKGGLVLLHVQAQVMEIFRMTGFSDFLNIR